MARFACVFLPNWSIERYRLHHRALPDDKTPFVLIAMSVGGWRLTASDPLDCRSG